jgi:(p)ppGpp synthase/HD superfamily hydrolase
MTAVSEALTVSEHDWTAELDHRVADLAKVLTSYLPAEQVAAVRDASYFAAEAHAGAFRKSGEPYIFHPLAVAAILAEVRFDYETLLAAILHDVIEDTHFDKDQLSQKFGANIADLVDGVSKLDHISFESRREAQAENFRKMFLAIAKDIRVLMVKLADRLHNMRTLEYMSPASRRRIARETLELYAPIAHRLGMNHLRLELEDLGFKHLYPLRYQIMKKALERRSGNRK